MCYHEATMTGTTERVVTTTPGHAALGLGDEQAVGLYRTMLVARAVDERQWILNRQGRQAFVISCQGHEAAQIGSAAAMRRGQDVMVPYYRDTAAAIAFGATPLDCLLEALSRANGPWTGGRMMPSHFSSPELKILTGSSSVGSHIPHATGAALAPKLRGEDSVALAYFGDGATAAGNFYEGVGFAAIHRLPAIFFCENNGLAISTRPELEMPVARVADRAAAFGIPGVVVDGTDVLAVYAVTREAVERARRGEGPTLIDAHCVRMTPHSSDDDHSRYRPADELESIRVRDPLPRYAWYLREHGLLDDALDGEIKQAVTAKVEAAYQEALTAPPADPSTALDHVLAEPVSSCAATSMRGA